MSKDKSEKELVKIENKSENAEKISSKSDGASENALVLWGTDTKQFLREVWIEVRPKNGRVTWPTFASVRVSTRVVILSSLGLGLFIGLCDMIFASIYSAIMSSAGNGLG